MAEPGKRTDHGTCVNHRRYKLSCQQYEGLLVRSDEVCEMCRRPLARGPRGKLAIDHCGPQWAVRGLLCNGCNHGVGDNNRDYPGAVEYLANTWWKQQCALLGLPETQRPEPEIGSAIRNQWGVVWVRLKEWAWQANTQAGHSWPGMSWKTLFESYGPHNLAPYDLHAAYADGSMPSDLRYVVERGRDWGVIRVAVGLPEAPLINTAARSPRGAIPWLKTPETTARILRHYLTRDERLRVAELLAQEDPETAVPF